MSQTFKVIMAGLVAWTFLLGSPPAHAILGIRAARNVIMARKAKQTLAEEPDPQTEKSLQNLKRLKQEPDKGSNRTN